MFWDDACDGLRSGRIIEPYAAGKWFTIERLNRLSKACILCTHEMATGMNRRLNSDALEDHHRGRGPVLST
eukprot:7244205-Heterocapsa_arctica.AAC.1